MAKSMLAGVAAAVAALACAATANPARHVTATCQHAGVPAVINHVPACLTSGARCKTAFQRQYERRGFRCSSGVLAKLHKPAPTTGVSTAGTPTAPASPLVSDATQVVVPRGQPLQIATRRPVGPKALQAIKPKPHGKAVACPLGAPLEICFLGKRLLLAG